jgi:hypothetical protein
MLKGPETMKFLHIGIALFYLIYSIVNFPQLGFGEWLIIGVTCAGLLIGWLRFKKDLTGMFLAGVLMGLMVEYITEAYWHYNFKVFAWPGNPIWGDISLYVVLGWGYSFSMFVLFTNWVYTKAGVPLTKARTLFFDALLAPIWFIPYELLGMQVLHLWSYTPCSAWKSIIPGINYPIEGVIGSVLFGLVLPSSHDSGNRPGFKNGTQVRP